MDEEGRILPVVRKPTSPQDGWNRKGGLKRLIIFFWSEDAAVGLILMGILERGKRHEWIDGVVTELELEGTASRGSVSFIVAFPWRSASEIWKSVVNDGICCFR